MGLFGKKKRESPDLGPVSATGAPAPAGPSDEVPTSTVIQMRQQGLSNNQIVQSLQREGYSSSQIFDAMSQADIKGIVESPGEAPPTEAGPAPAMPPPVSEASRGFPSGPPPAMPPPETGGASREEMEEIAESIIDEKWEDLMKAVDKIITWKEETEKKIIKIDQRMHDLKEQFDALHKGILGKIEEYDKGIKDVGTDIRAMEEVFKKTLPTFTENIHELSRLTKNIKAKKKKKPL